MALIETTNRGPLVVASTYWGSEVERAGKFFASCHAGCVRLLVPAARRAAIPAMCAARDVVLSRGPWPAAGLAEAVELLFDDGSDAPLCLYLSPESFDRLPAAPPPGRGWTLSAWDDEEGRPLQVLERPCHWWRVPRLPWLKPWGES